MEQLELFVFKIPNFEECSASKLIPYFMYFLSVNDESITSTQIKECFNKLSLQPYSNIPSYLNEKSKGKGALFLKNKDGYKLKRETKKMIANELSDVIQLPITNNLFNIEILNNTQYYLVLTAKQMISCYDFGLYDASLVMMRKLIETLIIECFERYNAENEIKDKNGVFYYLSDLIPAFINCKKWNLSRNIESSLKKVKKYGDLSAHNRRFTAKRSDFDDFKFELRQSIEEIVHLIDYPNWVKDKSKK